MPTLNFFQKMDTDVMAEENSGILSFCPEQDPLMAMAWRDALRWAAQQPWALDQFLEETGEIIPSNQSPIQREIDKATGANRVVAERFVHWFNDRIWGSSDDDLEEDNPFKPL